MTFYIENGVIAAVSWWAPEEAMRLPVTEEWVQQRMTIDPSRLTDENLLSILIGPEIALVNNGLRSIRPRLGRQRAVYAVSVLVGRFHAR